MDPFVTLVGRELRRAIADSDLSYAEVGRRLGLSRSAIPENLKNPGSISLDRLVGILQVVEVDPQEFFTRLNPDVDERLRSVEERLEHLESFHDGGAGRRSA